MTILEALVCNPQKILEEVRAYRVQYERHKAWLAEYNKHEPEHIGSIIARIYGKTKENKTPIVSGSHSDGLGRQPDTGEYHKAR